MHYITPDIIADVINFDKTHGWYLFTNKHRDSFNEMFGICGMEVCFEDIDSWICSTYGSVSHLEVLLMPSEENFNILRKSRYISNYKTIINTFIELYKPSYKMRLVDKIIEQSRK